MNQVFAYRANKILYNFIRSNNITGTVLLPSNICKDVVEVLKYAGLTLKFLDISKDTLCIDQNQIKENIHSASILLFVHTYGSERCFDNFFEELKLINSLLTIVDDRCLCFPNLNIQSSSADLVLYSTGEKKQVDLGKGGIGYVSQKYNYEEIEVKDSSCLTNELWEFNEEIFETKKKEVLKHKEKLNAIYYENLSSVNQLHKEFQNWRFNILTDKKELVLKALFAEGLFASNHYATHTYIQKCINAADLHKNVINLFNDLYYSEEQALRTCEIIKKIIIP
jgi:dTDP-4-amino-4,6-dideoxygalactose transaminase